ncbi:thermonuclease family protein [Bacillus massiliglaciei]|uniref:thermonuclease family protein n=1 Tax=Bacillus massiliglaciei TaxID=1816693 RepID=UPI000DA60C81|nr:thermonuclease family protein [Bacillus massiliglaciei]
MHLRVPSLDVQPFGSEASKFVKELLPPENKAEVEPGISELDKYRRFLAYFYVDGKLFNYTLIEKRGSRSG